MAKIKKPAPPGSPLNKYIDEPSRKFKPYSYQLIADAGRAEVFADSGYKLPRPRPVWGAGSDPKHLSLETKTGQEYEVDPCLLYRAITNDKHYSEFGKFIDPPTAEIV